MRGHMSRQQMTIGLGSAVALMATAGVSPSWGVVHDTSRVSVSSAEVAGNGPSSEPDISGSGRYVVFTSNAPNLTPGDDNAAADIFLRDTVAGTTRIVSRAGADASGYSRLPSVSDDGRYVAFLSKASNLVPADSDDEDGFLKDMVTGDIQRLDFGNQWVRMSAGGRYVALGAGEAYGAFRYDRVTGQTEEVSYSDQPDISATGRYVAGLSLDPADPGILFTDMDTGATRNLFDAAPAGWAPGHSLQAPVISRSGRYVAFITDATGLVGSDTARNDDVYLVDTQTNTFQRLTDEFSQGTTSAWNRIDDLALSGNGRVLSFELFDARSDSEAVVTLDRVTGLVSGIVFYTASPPSLTTTGTRVAYQSVEDQVEVASVAQCTISGTDGDDVLVGTNGADVICGRGGDDVVEGRNGADVLAGGPGFDTLSFAHANSDVAVSLRFYQSVGTGVDEVYGFQRVDGTPFDDTLRGGPWPDTLRGLGGNDRLLGTEANDRLYGGAGDDFLWGAIGRDFCDGGSGTDTQSTCETITNIP
jgi:Ca2+-binding RTX toxin-like protein